MKILHTIILCCIILGCEEPREDKTSVPVLPLIQPPIETSAELNTPSLLDIPDEEVSTTDHEAKYTFAPPSDKSLIIFGAYQSTRPLLWDWVKPKTISVTCNYELASSNESDPALLSILQVANTDSQSIDNNIARWKALFRSNDGGPVYASKKKYEIDGINATQITIHGEFKGAGSGWRLKDHLLQVVIFNNEEVTTYIKVLGSRTTVAQHEEAIKTFLQAIHIVDSSAE